MHVSDRHRDGPASTPQKQLLSLVVQLLNESGRSEVDELHELLGLPGCGPQRQGAVALGLTGIASTRFLLSRGGEGLTHGFDSNR